MLQDAGAGFAIFALAIIIFYSGELVWRERDAQLNQVMDAFPLQRWVLFSSKLLRVDAGASAGGAADPGVGLDRPDLRRATTISNSACTSANFSSTG